MKKFSRLKKASNKFALITQVAKEIISKLPVLPTNNVLNIIVEEIGRGSYDDISSIENYETNKELWVSRTREILEGRGILI